MICAVLSVVVLVARPGAQTLDEPTATAAFLSNFAQFTEWPAEALRPGDPLVICTTDPDVAARLEQLVPALRIAGRRVVARLVALDTPGDRCAVLYVQAIDQRTAGQLLRALGAAPVLTVSRARGFTSWGGIIELFVSNARMAFAINRDAAEQTGLRLSSKLLQLARPPL